MKNIHIISHSHWDREWYMPFEYHRAKLVELIDNCIELIENDEDFKCFNLDGHTALLEDYLEIRPQMRGKLKKYISEGRLSVGPWYVLQDEFLTSSEANIRNLLEGMKLAWEFGKVNMTGYFPDSFGNVGQMPQILKQAGMKAIYFGRGVKPTGAANEIYDFENYSSQFSEMYWQSPDGSSLPAILFANWYHNGVEMPKDGDRLYWDEKLAAVQFFASTDELLMMNGCDHQPVQKDITEAIRAAQKNYPQYNFIHSDFEKYADAVIKAMPENAAVIKGELTSQESNGWGTLVNTASSHMYIKRMNRECEIMLESVAEPLCVMVSRMGVEYPHDMLSYSWKTLMKNHPHDSICTCSCDAVMEEMITRFNKSRQAAETVINKNLEYIAKNIDVSDFADCKAVFTVVNTFSKPRNGIVSAVIDLERIYTHALGQCATEINGREKNKNLILVDKDGNEIPCSFEYNMARFGYDLPDDKFRQPYMAENITLTFEATDVPAMGYKCYGIKEGTAEKKAGLITAENTAENEFIKLKINNDGTFDVTDKKTGATYTDIGRLEDVGDLGNEYMFMQEQKSKPIYSDNGAVELICDEPYMAQYKVKTVMQIPESGDEKHHREVMECVPYAGRSGGRSEKTVELVINTYITLEKNAKSVKVKTVFENTAKDHRLRVLIPTVMNCSEHKVESVFDCVTRPNKHGENWRNPSECERQHGFVMMQENGKGISVANKGIYEYEILKDNVIALTLVRAVGDMGDWGVFPTTMSQCLREIVSEYEIIPFAEEAEAVSIAAEYQHPLIHVQNMERNGNISAKPGISWEGDMLKMTACKKSESGDIIMRWVNYSDIERTLLINEIEGVQSLYRSNVIEETGEELIKETGKWTIAVKPFEIITLKGMQEK